MNNRYAKSLELWDAASETAVPGSSTIAKHPKLATLGAYPIYAERALGSELTDVDGNRYIDFCSALGAIILGYNHESVNNAAVKQLRNGPLFSLSSRLPLELSRLLVQLVPSIEKVRLLKNGSDATSAAARIARAYTGRSKIAVCHYHGWHDWYYVSTDLGLGIPKSYQSEVIHFPYNDLEAVKQLIRIEGRQIAAFVLEPVHIDKFRRGYLAELRDLIHENGSLMIFDEVVTGFRFGLGGAQAYFEILPDLTCLAKALGNGFPISAVGGKAKYMDSTAEVITTMTYGEEALSTAAAIATLQVLQKEPVYEQIWSLGARFKERFNSLSKKYSIPINCEGYSVRLDLIYGSSKVADRKLLKSYFLQETAKRGILLGGQIFMTYSHTDTDLTTALKVCEEVLFKIAELGRLSEKDLDGALTEELW